MVEQNHFNHLNSFASPSKVSYKRVKTFGLRLPDVHRTGPAQYATTCETDRLNLFSRGSEKIFVAGSDKDQIKSWA